MTRVVDATLLIVGSKEFGITFGVPTGDANIIKVGALLDECICECSMHLMEGSCYGVFNNLQSGFCSCIWVQAVPIISLLIVCSV